MEGTGIHDFGRGMAMGKGPTRPMKDGEMGYETTVPLVRSQMDALDVAIEHLGNLLPELEKRVSPILSAPFPNPAPESRPILDVPLAEDLSRFEQRIEGITAYLADIITRVQV